MLRGLVEYRVQLTRTFTPEQYAQATESWGWLGLAGKTPIFTSPFGDVFFRADDGFRWLDTLEGTLTRPWLTADELNAVLNSADGRDMYLMGGLAMAAERSGFLPGPGQVYDFTISPCARRPDRGRQYRHHRLRGRGEHRWSTT